MNLSKKITNVCFTRCFVPNVHFVPPLCKYCKNYRIVNNTACCIIFNHITNKIKYDTCIKSRTKNYCGINGNYYRPIYTKK